LRSVRRRNITYADNDWLHCRFSAEVAAQVIVLVSKAPLIESDYRALSARAIGSRFIDASKYSAMNERCPGYQLVSTTEIS
jgi:hypothetical protein